MSNVALQTEQEAQINQDQLCTLYSFKEEKARYRKSYINWDKIKRANRKAIREKAKHLSKDAKDILAPVIQKLEKGERVILNHKYISTITFCKRGQNCNIIKQLETVLDITYHNSITHEGKKHRHSYEFAYYKDKIVSKEDNSTAQFIEREKSLNSSKQASFDTSIENKDIEYIRSNVHAHESNFLQNSEINDTPRSRATRYLNVSEDVNYSKQSFGELDPKEIKIEKNPELQITELPKEPVKPAKLKTRPANERKKRTNSERKARIYHFNQYKEPQDLGYHYPLNKEDEAKLQSLSGRDFSLNAMNEILLDMSKRLDNSFGSKTQFMAYFGTCLKYEKRDAVKTGNDNFYIKANHTNEELATVEKEKQVEQYLAEVEQKAITHVCPENQLKARIANVLEPLRAYALLSNIKDLAVIGSIVKIYLRADYQLSGHEKDVVLSQVKSIYSTHEVNIESVEYLVENVCKQTNCYDEVRTKGTPVIPTLQQGIWGDICRQLIKTYGIHIYNNWFSKLTPVIDEDARTVELKAPNLFIQQWIETNYGEIIMNIIKNLGFELKEISSSYDLKRG